MSYWIKIFPSSTIIGTDEDVRKGIASWSRGLLDEMIGAGVSTDDGYYLEISGLGDYWQSDTYENVYGSLESKRVQRRIERRIRESDLFYCVVAKGDRFDIFFNQLKGRPLPIRSTEIGQWLILEYDERTHQVRYYFRGERL